MKLVWLVFVSLINHIIYHISQLHRLTGLEKTSDKHRIEIFFIVIALQKKKVHNKKVHHSFTLQRPSHQWSQSRLYACGTNTLSLIGVSSVYVPKYCID